MNMVLQDKKWGVLNKDGSVLVEPTYDLGVQAQPSFIANYYMIDNGSGQIYYAKD